MASPTTANGQRPPIHATNAWNPTGRNLEAVPGCRLYATCADGLRGRRTLVFLGSQQHLTFVGDLEGEVPREELRAVAVTHLGLYPHIVDLEPSAGRPRPFSRP